MRQYAKTLYNVGWYSIRPYHFLEGRYLRYESNYHTVKVSKFSKSWIVHFGHDSMM